MPRTAIGYIDGKLGSEELDLRRVRLEFLDAAGMGFAHVDSIAAERIDDFEIMAEHVWVLIIFLGYVLADGRRQGDMRRLAERERELVGVSAVGHHIVS